MLVVVLILIVLGVFLFNLGGIIDRYSQMRSQCRPVAEWQHPEAIMEAPHCYYVMDKDGKIRKVEK